MHFSQRSSEKSSQETFYTHPMIFANFYLPICKKKDQRKQSRRVSKKPTPDLKLPPKSNKSKQTKERKNSNDKSTNQKQKKKNKPQKVLNEITKQHLSK